MQRNMLLSVFLAVLMAASAAEAQTMRGAFIEFGGSGWATPPVGLGHIGDIYRTSQGEFPTPIGTNLRNSSNMEPVVVGAKEKLFWHARGGYVNSGAIGFQGSFYRSVGSGDTSGQVTTPSGSGSFFNGFQTWTFVPVAVNRFQPGGLSPVDYAGDAGLEIMKGGGSLLWNMVDANQARAGLMVGLSAIRSRSTQTIRIDQEGFLPEPRNLNNGLWDQVTFFSTGTAEGTMVGPEIGSFFDVHASDRISIGGQLSLTFPTWGRITESGEWAAREQFRVGLGSPGVVPSHGPIVSTVDTIVPFDTSRRTGEDKRMLITDASVAVGYRMFNGCLELGVGAFVSRIDNLIHAPTWTIDVGAPLAASRWELNLKPVMMINTLITAKARF